jgi:hypothetical protein
MEYIKLIFGIGFIVIFTWILIKNRNRSGFIHTLFRIDTLAGMVAGFYLIFTSVHSLLVH